ncbi:MAG: hypothetical protein C4326_04930 [Ignavibacteria bacterium]
MPEKPSMLLPALYGGIIMGVISAVPGLNLVNCLCCAGVMFGGFMAVFFYKKELTPEMPPLSSADGMQLGALAGVFGGIIGGLLSIIILQLAGNVGGEMILQFMEGLKDTMPPDAWDQMERSIREGEVSIFNLIIGIIIDVVFGLIGGLIGYSVFRSKDRPAHPPQSPAAV